MFSSLPSWVQAAGPLIVARGGRQGVYLLTCPPSFSVLTRKNSVAFRPRSPLGKAQPPARNLGGFATILGEIPPIIYTLVGGPAMWHTCRLTALGGRWRGRACGRSQAMIDLSRTQDEEVGDGTTSVIILAGELMHNAIPFMEKSVHPTVVVRGYTQALHDACLLYTSPSPRD